MNKLISKAATLIEALPYLQKYRDKIFVCKYGGHAMTDESLRESFMLDMILLKHVGIHPIVVHGGGPQIEQALKKMGIKTKAHNGLRITDAETMKVVEMVLVGQVNSGLVTLVNKLGGRAVGFSGNDGCLIEAKKLGVQRQESKSGKTVEVDLGMVGEVTQVNPEILEGLVYEDMFIPIIAPIGLSEQGESLNINADTAACEIAQALQADKLIFLTDVSGVQDKNGKLISELNRQEIGSLIEGKTIHGGMIPKIRSCEKALNHGVDSVVILDGQIKHAVLLEIFTDKGVGTLIR